MGVNKVKQHDVRQPAMFLTLLYTKPLYLSLYASTLLFLCYSFLLSRHLSRAVLNVSCVSLPPVVASGMTWKHGGFGEISFTVKNAMLCCRIMTNPTDYVVFYVTRYTFLFCILSSWLLNKGPVLLCLKPSLILYLFFPVLQLSDFSNSVKVLFFQMRSQLLSTLAWFLFPFWHILWSPACYVIFWSSERSQVIPACVGLTHAFLIFIYYFALDFGTVYFIHFILCLCKKSAVLLDFFCFFWWTLGLQSLFPPPEPNCTQRH